MGKFSDAYRKVRDAYKAAGLKEAYKVCRSDFWCRVCMETTLPVVFGVGWAAFALLTSQGWYAAISGFGIAFMFIMPLQAQPLRIDKNVQDAQDADEFRNSFSTIRQGIDALRQQGLAKAEPDQPKLPEPPIDRWNTNVDLAYSPGPDFSNPRTYIAHAARTVELGEPYAGVLLAAVGFEQAVRQAADRMSINPRQSLGRIIEAATAISTRLSDGDEHADERLWTLIKLRNGLVHGETGGDINIDQAADLIEAFARGIDRIEWIETGENPKHKRLVEPGQRHPDMPSSGRLSRRRR